MKQKLEDKCRWKESLKGQIVVDGRMRRCKECNGYDIKCGYYVPIKKIKFINDRNLNKRGEKE